MQFNKELLSNYYAFKFIYMLSQPWEETDAYKLGIVDKTGNFLKKRSELKTDDERAALTRFNKLVYIIKQMLSKVPLTQSTIGRYSTALAMIKEECGLDEDVTILEDVFLEEMCTSAGIDMSSPPLFYPKKRKQVEEESDETFADNPVFHYDDDDIFLRGRFGKKKYAKYSKYVGEDEVGKKIRNYARNNPKKNIILKNKKTGAMFYLRKH